MSRVTLPRGVKLPGGVTKEQILLAITAYLSYARTEGWTTQDGAYGCCYEATDEFLIVLGRQGIDDKHLLVEAYYFHREEERSAYPLRLDLHQDMDPEKGYYDADHHAARVGNLIIDWTARQFDPKANFPHMWIDNGRPRQEPRGKITQEWYENRYRTCSATLKDLCDKKE